MKHLGRDSKVGAGAVTPVLNDPVTERLRQLFAAHDRDSLEAALERVIEDPEREDGQMMVRGLARHATQLEQMARSRRADRRALADLSALNLRWGAGLILWLWERDDPFHKALAHALAPEADRAGERARRLLETGLLSDRAAAWLAEQDHNLLCWRLWQGHAYAWAAVLYADRLLDIQADTTGLPAGDHRRFLEAWISRQLTEAAQALDHVAAYGRFSEDQFTAMLGSAQAASTTRVACDALRLNPQLQHDLEPLVEAHKRALGESCLSEVPVFAVSDLRWLEQMELHRWVEPVQDGRTRAVAYLKQVVMLGPDETNALRNAAARGELHPTVMHELLHCLPSHTPDRPLPDDLRDQDFAWREGGQQAWAEQVCAAARDPDTGLAGGRERTPAYCGWKNAVRALAEHLDRPLLDVARDLGSSGRGDALTQVARWLHGSGDEPALRQVAERFGPVLLDAHRDRSRAGVGERTYRQVRALLHDLA